MTFMDDHRELKRKVDLMEKSQTTEKKKKQFKWPWKWRRKFGRSIKKVDDNQILVIFLNKKQEIEPPRFMPIFYGNMIVWKNKPYEFDPRALWRMKGVKKNPMVYLIREIDRRPVKNPDGTWRKVVIGGIEEMVYSVDSALSNLDIEEVRMRGDSTDSDEFLIKAALKAQTSSMKKQANIAIVIIIILVVVGGLGYFLLGGGT